jgi:hypothetical protein
VIYNLNNQVNQINEDTSQVLLFEAKIASMGEEKDQRKTDLPRWILVLFFCCIFSHLLCQILLRWRRWQWS